MFYTQCARVIATISLLLGIVSIGLGFALAYRWISDGAAFMERYFPGTSIGEMVDRGGYALLVGVAFGVVAEISIGIHRLYGTPPR